MSVKIFIAGTDTNVGKTYISAGMLTMYNTLGYSTLGIKPVATGCLLREYKLYSEDALKLQDASSIKLDYDSINPHAFAPAIAPHIAAQNYLSVDILNRSCYHSMNYSADICLIEGVGGWYVPLNMHETMSDFVISNQLKVILVVGIRLGCLNHAILTARAIQKDGAELIGWIANCVDESMPHAAENISTLKHWLHVPCLGVVNFMEKPEITLTGINLT